MDKVDFIGAGFELRGAGFQLRIADFGFIKSGLEA
jgi:hypothetical protein